MASGAPTFGSLFSGIGGLDLGLERAGWQCRFQVEIDPFCQKVLAKHWPDVRRYGDITKLDGTEFERVDLLAGGFPCQPVSLAGKRKAQGDERWLWPEFFRIVRSIRPRFVLVENVPGLLSRGFGDVLGDLAASGYDAEWDCIPAAAVGAPHLRYRVFVVAYAECSERWPGNPEGCDLERQGCIQKGRQETAGGPGVSGADLADSAGWSKQQSGAQRYVGRFQKEILREGRHSDYFAVEPNVGRVAHGVASRVDRLRAIGNAVVPQVAEWIGRGILAQQMLSGAPE